MGVRNVEIDGRTIRAGTSDDAAKLWVSERSPKGVSPAVFRHYVRVSKIAPGPIMVPDPAAEGELVPLRDGATGGHLWDLDEVARVNAARQGQGRRTARDTAETLRRTALREHVLEGARDGQLRIVPESGRTELGGELQDRRTAQAVTELRHLQMLTDPAADTGQVAITRAGTDALVRWARP